MQEAKFPLELLEPQTGVLSFNEFGASVVIPLAPFTLPDHDDIETKVLIDCIKLPATTLSGLTGRSFEFPRSSTKDAPEGSVYMGYHHHPVDLLFLTFGEISGGAIEARFAVGIAFSIEGLSASDDAEYGDIGWEFATTLAVADDAPLLH
jgi:hypothetical protein